MGVLTTGFNAPAVDLIAMLRPTKSAGLYVQMAGRGTRLSPGKSNCLVLDFAGNVALHGPIDAVMPSPPGKGDGEPPSLPHVLARGHGATLDPLPDGRQSLTKGCLREVIQLVGDGVLPGHG